MSQYIFNDPQFQGDDKASWTYWVHGDTVGTLTKEVIWQRLRENRNYLLAASDFRMLPDAPSDSTEWAKYRQALRDLPDNTKDPRKAAWPKEPE